MRMGELPKCTVGSRDAFHVPAVTAWSNGPLRPGEPVRFLNDELTLCGPCEVAAREGVVDPLLREAVPPGTVVWVVLDNDLVPGTLTHNFEVKRRPVASVRVTPAPAHMQGSIVTMEVPDPPANPNTVTMETVPPAPPVPPDDSDDGDNALDDDDDDDELNCNVRPPCV